MPLRRSTADHSARNTSTGTTPAGDDRHQHQTKPTTVIATGIPAAAAPLYADEQQHRDVLGEVLHRQRVAAPMGFVARSCSSALSGTTNMAAADADGDHQEGRA